MALRWVKDFAVLDTRYIIKIFVHDVLVKFESKMLKGKNNNNNSTVGFVEFLILFLPFNKELTAV